MSFEACHSFRRWSRPVLPVALLGVLALSGCATLRARGEPEAGTARAAPWLRALFPEIGPGPARAERHDGHVAFVHGGRVYGSTGDDLPGEVLAMATGLGLALGGPSMLRVGQVGFGTGVGVGMALGAGSRMVDVFEQDGSIVTAGAEIAARTGLSYHEGQPLHPALRIVGPELAATERFLRYDVLVSPPAASVLSGPARLLTVERLEALASVLGSGGVLVHHVPAYEMSPETYRRLLRTFAHVFPHVIGLSTGPGSGDTFLAGSSRPLAFVPAALSALAASPALAPLLAEAGLGGPMDIPARVLFASREEVLAFVEGAAPCTAASPLPADATPPRPPAPPPGAAEDAWTAWAEAVAAHRARFERMAVLRASMLGLDWTYGAVCPEGVFSPGCLIGDVPADASGARALADLALALMAAGRLVEARPTIEAAVRLAAPRPVARAARAQVLLLGDLPDLSAHLPEALADERAAASSGSCAGAPETAVAAVLSRGAEAGPDERVAAASVAAVCGPDDPAAMETVWTLVGSLARDEAYRRRYPAVLYLAARAAVVLGRYPEATSLVLAFVDAVGPSTEAAPAPSPPAER